MITWLRENSGIVSLATSLILVISTAAVAYHELSNLIAAQVEVQKHINDSTRHLDPMRDGMTQKHLVERLERLEKRMERMEAQGRRVRRNR